MPMSMAYLDVIDLVCWRTNERQYFDTHVCTDRAEPSKNPPPMTYDTHLTKFVLWRGPRYYTTVVRVSAALDRASND